MKRTSSLVISVVIAGLVGALPLLADAAFPGRNGKISFDRFGGPQRGGVFTVNPDGSGQQRLNLGSGLVSGVAWSPDGTRIAYARCALRDCPRRPPAGSGNYDLWTARADGSAARRLTHTPALELWPSWSPDGKQIAFERFGNGRRAQAYRAARIFVIPATGGKARAIAGSGAHVPAWSPDGKRIAFVRCAIGCRAGQLFTVAPDGSDLQRLGTMVTRGSLDWSPDGKMIAFQGTATTGHGDPAIWLANADGSAAHQLTPDGLEGQTAAWSPDGQEIVFVGFPSATDHSAGYQVMTINADGSGLKPLTSGRGPYQMPHWQPLP